MAPYPEWSYSISRANTFNKCPRKYYYHYYGSHQGWDQLRADESQIRTYRLKQLKNMYLVFGELAHQMCESIVRAWDEKRKVPRSEHLLKVLQHYLNKAYQQSKDKEAWMQQPKTHWMLFEMYYLGYIQPERIQTIKERMQACIPGFFATKTWKELTETQGIQIVEIEKWDTMIVHETKVYVKMDLLFRTPEGKLVIVDWKTGKEDDFRDQLNLYALYASRHYNVPLDQIEVRIEYLLTGQHESYTVTEEDVEAVKLKIQIDVEEMRSCVEDTYYNRPKPMAFFTPMPSRSTCQSCNFLEICSARMSV